MVGLYIVLEGVVGTGKSTQAKLLHGFFKKKYPDKEIVLTREPGGTEISEAIRKCVQGTKYSEAMHPICEAYLYAAARSQSLRTIVEPVLEKDGIVISDRSFISSMSYQGYARGLGIDRIRNINKFAVDNIIPDKILFLDLDPEIGLHRTFDKEGDKFEKENVEFFRKIAEGYQKISLMPEFKDKWIRIDASGKVEEVNHRIVEHLKKT
ncbi:MAG: dTMP kinase [archaeon]